MPNKRETNRFCYPAPDGSGLWYTRNEYIKEFGRDAFFDNGLEDEDEIIPYDIALDRELERLQQKKWWRED